ncbi:MAG: glycosyltransferase family 1 protein [Bacilli bacterium]|nr:glycosyltransferase family 1 protein [Bacilli bacterium]
MNEQVKVLYFVDRMLRGGIQSLVIDWVSRFDRNKIHVDFLLLDDGKKYELEDELKKLGCNVYKLEGMWIRKPTDFIKYSKMLDDFFKEHNDYKVVHLNSSSKNYMVLKYAKKYNIPIRIAHSHTIMFQSKNKLKILVGNIFKNRLVKYATDYFACSEIAGEWLFGKKIIKSNKFKVIHNAVDYDMFKFNQKKRQEVRKQYNINKNDIVIGHVGRFNPEKNHLFMIDLLSDLVNKNNNYKLMFVGKGPLENEIKKYSKELKIYDNIIFCGFQSSVNDYLNAMDIFLFPSKFEGLGLSLIEAQANGLPCIASSDGIPKEAKATSLLTFISLEEKKNWIDKIISINTNRKNTKSELKKSKYFINDIVLELEKKYLN